MKFYSKLLIGLFTLLYLSACSTGPQPIEFGKDECYRCNMTIMDNKHAAETVTSKGKVYKYDSIECMIRYIAADTNIEYSHLLISDFANPGELVNAQVSTYLISQNLPSPMGAFLTGFASDEIAQLKQEELGGVVYSWEDVQATINN